jgi:uncharacterized membrane protein
MADSHARSLAKAISWRVTGTLDTFFISWLITGHPLIAGGIAGTEVMTKIALFYLHERVWARLRWGRDGGREAHWRSLAKAVSWRTTGTIDTFLVSLLITGELALAGGIAATEVLTKVVLYYLHERAWARLRWGHTGEDPVARPGPAATLAQPGPTATQAAG